MEVALGSSYNASGCTSALPTTQLKMIEAAPAASYVEIDSRRYDTIGAIRAQL